MTYKRHFTRVIMIGLLAFWAPSMVDAAVPRRNIALVCIQLDDTTATENATKGIIAFARERLNLNPSKTIAISQPRTFEDLRREFSSGKVFRRVSHDDMILVYLIGGKSARSLIKFGDGSQVRLRQLFELREALRKGPDNNEGFYEGSFVFMKQSAALENIKPPPNTAFLSIHGDVSPLTIGITPDDADPLWAGIHERIKERGLIERSAVTLMAAFESIITSAERDNRVSDLPRRMKHFTASSAQLATVQTGANWNEFDAPLFMKSIRIALFPRLLKNNETKRILGALKLELDTEVAPSLKPHVKIAVLDESDPTADIRCQVVASTQKAHVECVELRAPIFSDWVSTVNLDDTLKPIVRQILRDYTALTQTDWSQSTRRDLRPLDIYVLVDTSLSMAYHDPTAKSDPQLKNGPSKRETFLIRLASAVSEHAQRTGRPARLTVLLFGENVNPLRMPGSSNGTVTLRQQLSPEQLNAMGASFRLLAKPQRYTGIEAALTETALRMSEVSEAVTRHVILITDGKESVNRADPRGAVKSAARSVRTMGATLDVIGLSESEGRLEGYLERMRAGGAVLKRYVQLLDMTFAPPVCRTSDGWSSSMARKCGRFFANLIKKDHEYDASLLDEVRQSQERGVPTGMFMQPNSQTSFQDQIQVLISSIVGKGIYASKSAKRDTAANGRIIDHWLFKMNVPGRAKVVLYNGDRLRDLEFEVYRNDQRLTRSDALLVSKESDSTTVVTLPAPASGTFKIIRSGVPQK